MTPAIIQQQIVDATTEAATVTELHHMSDYTDIHGQPFLARDRLRKIYEGRLRGVLQRAPERTDLEHLCRSVLTSLAAVANDEPLYSWRAQTSSRRLSGISTPLRVVAFFPDETESG
ncbi:MAG: hypothetical protein RIS76_1593 [Verrucomicrobiota bacterium]|jgi:hypothetical protein